MLETMTHSKRISARLRGELRTRCGVALLSALDEYLYKKEAGEFDTRRPWQIMEVLELSEMAHRLKDLAEHDVVNLELARLSREVFADYRRVYDVTMARTQGAASMEFFHHPGNNDNRGRLTIVD